GTEDGLAGVLGERHTYLRVVGDRLDSSVVDHHGVAAGMPEHLRGGDGVARHPRWAGRWASTMERRPSWICPFEATSVERSRANGSPRWSVTIPPASVTRRTPAATSHGPSANSQCPSN